MQCHESASAIRIIEVDWSNPLPFDMNLLRNFLLPAFLLGFLTSCIEEPLAEEKNVAPSNTPANIELIIEPVTAKKGSALTLKATFTNRSSGKAGGDQSA